MKSLRPRRPRTCWPQPQRHWPLGGFHIPFIRHFLPDFLGWGYGVGAPGPSLFPPVNPAVLVERRVLRGLLLARPPVFNLLVNLFGGKRRRLPLRTFHTCSDGLAPNARVGSAIRSVLVHSKDFSRDHVLVAALLALNMGVRLLNRGGCPRHHEFLAEVFNGALRNAGDVTVAEEDGILLAGSDYPSA